MAACTLRDEDALRAAFDGLTDDVADTVAQAVLTQLEGAGDLKTWGWACNHVITSGFRQAAREAQKGISVWVAPARRMTNDDYNKQLLRKYAFRILNAGSGRSRYAQQMREANATLRPPLPEKEFNALAIWCAKKFVDERNNAR